MTINDSIQGIRAMVASATASGLYMAGVALKQKTRQVHGGSDTYDSRLTESIDFVCTGPDVSSSYVPEWVVGSPKLDSDTPISRDKLPVPTQPLSMVFGAGAPFAGYVERGTVGPYTGAVGNATPEDGTFREKIRHWALANGLDEEAAVRIADKIWARGTDAQPFMPTEEAIIRTIKEALTTTNREIFRRTRLPDLVFKVRSK